MITGNCRYMGKYKNIFPYFSSILYKIVDCLEKKKTLQGNMGFIIYVAVKYMMAITQRMGG